tara:strand:+ start:72 stop:632 length:561 start_codon:yes stop_codon:yes gene_type:complete
MASLEDIGIQSHGYYKPESKPKLEIGWYPSHIIQATLTQTKVVRKHFRAKIYNIKFQISNSEGFFLDSKKPTNDFANYIVDNNGLFFFLAPQEGDDFKFENNSNRVYYHLLDCCDIPMEKLDDGTYLLTEVEPSVLIGKPIFIYLDKSKPFIGKFGDKVELLQVQKFRRWNGGDVKEQREGLKLPI